MTGAPSGRLRVRSLGVAFGGVDALRDVTFEVGPGQVIGVLGPNGAGKTTLLNAMSGVIRPTTGSVVLEGEELAGRPAWEIARLGLVRTFQEPGLFGRLDVVDNLRLGRYGRGGPGFLAGMAWFGPSRREERALFAAVEATIDALGLSAHRGQPVGSLPYGTQKRIELARALLADPAVLLLDEPVAGVDEVDAVAMASAVRRARADGVGVVLVEHDVPFVAALADHVVVLDAGSVLCAGTPAEVRADERVIAAYLGGPEPVR
jgi:branched-chain amino acid transport system ATP-binding protein